MTKITIKDVAELAGVSVATVSRVLNGKGSVKEENVALTMKAVEQLHFKPNIAAKYIRGQTSKIIAMLVPEIVSPFYARIANGAIARAQEMGQSVLLMTSNRDPETEMQCLQQLADHMIDGLIYAPLDEGVPLKERRDILSVPTTIVGHRHVLEDTPHIYVDNFNAGYIAAKYLLKLGRRRISLVTGFWLPDSINREDLINCTYHSPQSGVYSGYDRLLGYRKALEEMGVPFDDALVQIAGFDYEAGFHAMKTSYENMLDVDGVIASNDMVAAGIINFLKQQNIKVPDSVSVIGHGDVLVPEIAEPQLTSINQKPYELGRQAVNVVNRLIAGEDADDVTIDVSLSIRASTCGVH